MQFFLKNNEKKNVPAMQISTSLTDIRNESNSKFSILGLTNGTATDFISMESNKTGQRAMYVNGNMNVHGPLRPMSLLVYSTTFVPGADNVELNTNDFTYFIIGAHSGPVHVSLSGGLDGQVIYVKNAGLAPTSGKVIGMNSIIQYVHSNNEWVNVTASVSAVSMDEVHEKNPDSGVTVDGVLMKDGSVLLKLKSHKYVHHGADDHDGHMIFKFLDEENKTSNVSQVSPMSIFNVAGNCNVNIASSKCERVEGKIGKNV